MVDTFREVCEAKDCHGEPCSLLRGHRGPHEDDDGLNFTACAQCDGECDFRNMGVCR